MRKKTKKIIFLQAALFLGAAFHFLSLAFFLLSLFFALFAFFNCLPSTFLPENLWLALRILQSTVYQAFLSSSLAVLLAIPSALLLGERRFPFSSFFLKLYFIPLCVPSLIFALAYITFFGNSGILNLVLTKILKIREEPVRFLYSFKAVFIAHAAYNFPLAVKLISESYREIDFSQMEAALIAGGKRWKIFTKIIFPNLKNAVITSFIVIFYLSFFSFTIVLLFGGLGVTTLEVEIYRAVKFSLDFKKASLYAATSLFFSLTLGFAVEKLKRKKKTMESVFSSRVLPPLKSASEKIAFLLLASFTAFFLLFPLSSLFFSSFVNANGKFTLDAWKNLFLAAAFYKALLTSLKSSACTVIFTALQTIFHAYLVYRIPKFSKISYIPLAVSPLVLSVGFLLFPFSGKLPSFFVLSVAESSLFWPYAYFLIQTKAASLSKEAMEAALILRRNKREAFLEIMIPFMTPAIKNASLLIFALSLADSSLPLMLNLRGYTNLSLLLFSYASSYRINESAGLAFVMLLLCFLRKN